MGFSSGDFADRHGARFHWEIKDGPRIVLWTAGEQQKLLELSVEEARLAAAQLEFMIRCAGPEEPPDEPAG